MLVGKFCCNYQVHVYSTPGHSLFKNSQYILYCDGGIPDNITDCKFLWNFKNYLFN